MFKIAYRSEVAPQKNSREKFTHKEIKHEYQLENYLKNIRNPAHRISITKLRLGVHSLRIQTGKYEYGGASNYQ